MQSTAKVAITIPLATFRQLERARQRLRTSRSAAITRALDEWLRGQSIDEEDRRYIEAYLRHPEQTDEVGAVASAAVSSWERWK